jgi:hypothetical protein
MDFRYRHKTTSKYVLLTREIILLFISLFLLEVQNHTKRELLFPE